MPELKPCPMCGSGVSPRATVCRSCGDNLQPLPQKTDWKSCLMASFFLGAALVGGLLLFKGASSVVGGLFEAVAPAELDDTTENTGHNMLAEMGDTKRNSTLAHLVQGSDNVCLGESNFFQGFDESTNAYWNVRCTNGEAYLVQVLNDAAGSTQILSCSILEEVGGNPCFTTFQEAHDLGG